MAEGRRNSQERGNHEYRAIAEFVAHISNEQRGENVPGGIKSLILPKLSIESSRANNPERNRRDRGRKERSRATNQECRGIYPSRRDPPHQQNRSRNQDAEAARQQRPFAMHGVDDRPRRSLHSHGHQTAEGQHVAYTCGVPSARRQIRGQERPETRLHVCEKKVQPLNQPQASLFSRLAVAHNISSWVGVFFVAAGPLVPSTFSASVLCYSAELMCSGEPCRASCLRHPYAVEHNRPTYTCRPHRSPRPPEQNVNNPCAANPKRTAKTVCALKMRSLSSNFERVSKMERIPE